MYIGIKAVKPLDGYKLHLTFSNNEERIFNMNEYLTNGIFAELKNEKIFRTAHVSFDTVEWANGADLDPEILYNESSRI